MRFRVIKVRPVVDGWWDPHRLSLSAHLREDRRRRLEHVERSIGYGRPVRVALVDAGHPAGREVHVLTDTGLILVLNERSHRLVTVLVARPGQVWRYYEPSGEAAPEPLLKRARYNTQVRHWND